jgi:hypothetical protein
MVYNVTAACKFILHRVVPVQLEHNNGEHQYRLQCDVSFYPDKKNVIFFIYAYSNKSDNNTNETE